MVDKIVDCRKCGSPFCYEAHVANVVDWRCIGCGFHTNTLLLNNTDAVKALESTLPELFNEIKFIDKDSFVWYPMVIDQYGIGMIFPDPLPNGDWRWAFAPHVKVEEHEKEKFALKGQPGKYAEYKTNLKAVLHFDKEYYTRALEALELL